MRKRIIRPDSRPAPGRRRTGAESPDEALRWENKILLYLEGRDPKVLDKEVYKVYRKIQGTGARIEGPVPLPVRRLSEDETSPDADRVHRRLFHILFPTERTVSLLDKLALSGSVQTSISVEEIPA